MNHEYEEDLAAHEVAKPKIIRPPRKGQQQENTMTSLHLVGIMIALVTAKFAVDGECTIAATIGWLILIIVLAVASVWRVV